MSKLYEPPFRMTDEMTALVVEIGELLGGIIAYDSLNANPVLRRQNRIRTIHSSLAIEQNTLTLEQVTDVIDGHYVLGSPREIREVKNAYDAYEHLEQLDPASLDDLLLAHRWMMQDLISDAGCYRSGNVGVFDGDRCIHAGTPAKYVPEVMTQLFDWMRRTSVHPLIRSCIFHYEFEFIHPFSDGNGRTGRLWQTLILSRWKPIFAWLPIETVIHTHQNEYYLALNAANRHCESTGFVVFMLGLIRDALRDIRQTQERHVGTNVGTNVGANEDRILGLLRADGHLTAREMASRLGLVQRQVERILAKLKQSGRIVRHGASKNGYWEVK